MFFERKISFLLLYGVDGKVIIKTVYKRPRLRLVRVLPKKDSNPIASLAGQWQSSEHRGSWKFISNTANVNALLILCSCN